MRALARRAATILATGYILYFYSERLFWSFLRPGDQPGDLILGWLVYSLLAWIFLLLVRQCRVASFPALYVAGAVFGWLAEGVVVDTLYGSPDNPFPLSISFTGLAWHALITVGLGWYVQAKVLTGARPWKSAVFAIALGVGWGLWAGWWPAELDRASTSAWRFAAHAAACSILLVLSWIVLGSVRPGSFRPGRLELPILLGLAALFFALVRVPATPRSALILPPLLLLCTYGLWRSRHHEERPDLLEMTLGRIRPAACLPLLLMPAAAIAIYAPVAILGWTLPTNWLLYLTTMPLGFICLLLALWRLHRLGR